MRRVSKRMTGTCEIEDTEYLESKVTNYCDLCQLHLFYDIVKLQYFGLETDDTHFMLHDIYLVLLELKFVFKIKRKTISIIPDTLYQRFIKFSHLLLF